jgi:ribosomal-protein-alanine N-acetyltransferase
MSSVVIEPMAGRHLDDVVRIEAQASPTPWTRSMFADSIEPGGERAAFVAIVGALTVGFSVLLMQAGDAHLMNIAVDPAHRRNRLGQALLLAVVDAALGRGAEAVTLEVRASNRAAQRLYHRFGFVPSGVRPRYYQGEDAVIMWTPPLDDRDWLARIAELRAEAS